MKKIGLSDSVAIPSGIEIHLDNNIIKVKGKTEVVKNFKTAQIKIKKADDKITFSVKGNSRKDKSILNTGIAQLNNMIKGSNENYVYKLKICSGHFPMNVTIDKNKIVVKNFLGEKLPRIAKIVDNVQVKVAGDIITVESNDKERAGQVSANIEIATRIPNKDRRVFQDGCFIIERNGELIKWNHDQNY